MNSTSSAFAPLRNLRRALARLTCAVLAVSAGVASAQTLPAATAPGAKSYTVTLKQLGRNYPMSLRGVEATGVMETLVERRLIKVVGRKETIGRPLLYGTSSEFLRHFGLKHLSELPDLNTFVAQQPLPTGEIQQELIEEQEFTEQPAEAAALTEEPMGAETQ